MTPLSRGVEAPLFSLPDQTGALVALGDLVAKGPVVVFFYPAALSPGCTAESCRFRDLSGAFAAYGASPVGISSDDVSRQRQFADTYSFDFPLLSDPDGAVAAAYGVRRRLKLAPNRRATFVVGTDGLVADVIRSEVRFAAHADRALAAVAALSG